MKKFFDLNKTTAWLSKNRVILVFCLVFFIGAYLRLNNFSDLARFNDDQVRDAKIIDSIFETGEFPLLGPKAGGTSFNLGPAFYCLQYFSALIFGQTPQGMAFFIPILSVFSIGLFFLFFKNIFSNRTTLALTVLYTTSFFAIKYSRFAWNPNAAPFFLFAFLNLYLAILNKKRSLYYHIALAVIIGISIQLHTIMLILLPISYAGLYIHLYLKNKKISLREICVTSLIILFLNIPFFLSDIKNSGENIKNFFSGTQTKTQQNASLISNLSSSLSFMTQGITYTLSGFEPQKNWARPIKLIQSKNLVEIFSGFSSFLFLIIGLYALAKKIKASKNPNQKNALLLLSFSTLASFLLFLVVGEELNLRFFIVIFYLPFLLTGLLFESLKTFFPEKFRLYVSILGLFFMILFTTLNIAKYNKVYDLENYQAKESAYGGISLGESKNICSFIANQSQDEQEKTYLADFEFEKTVKYICQKQGISISSFSAKNTSPESSVFMITKKENAEKASGDYASSFIITDSKNIGRFTIFSMKKDNSKACKIGFITDIHASYSKSSPELIRKESSIPLRNFIGQMNDSFHPDIVVQGGDVIDGREDDSARALTVFENVMKIFSDLDAPYFNVMGNHETRSGGISKNQWIQKSKLQNSYYSTKCKDTQILVLDGMDGATEHAYVLSKTQLDWLKEIFKKEPNKKRVVFIHEPLIPRSKISTKIKSEKEFSDQDAQNIKELLSQNGVIAIFSGHAEALFHAQDTNISHHVLPGVLKSKDEAVSWLQSFYEITITDNVNITMHYKKDVSEKEYHILQIPSPEFDIIEK